MAGPTARRPVLVFDGDCAFCTSCARLLERIGPEAEIIAWQRADLPALGITATEAAEAVRWANSDGTVRAGHEAIAAALCAAGQPWRTAGRTILLPGISPLAAATYRLIARNRHRLPGGTPACAIGASSKAATRSATLSAMGSDEQESGASENAAARAEVVRQERLRADAQRPMSVNLAEGIALSHQLIQFVGAARRN